MGGAVSTVTGANFPQNTADGGYLLRGIIPGRKYAVEYGELSPQWVGGSAIGMYGDDHDPDQGVTELPRSGFGYGPITGGSGKLKEVSCEKGGQTIVMDTVQLGIEAPGIAPKSSQIVTPPPPAGGGGDGEAEESGGGCTLVIP